MRLPLLFVILFSCLPALLPAQNPGPGDIAPDAVYIDMDEWYPFSEGLAAIKKGDKWAFIDTTGKIVIPWGKVEPVDPAPAFSQGRIIVKVGQGMGIADEKGNILTQKVYKRISGFQLNPQAEKVCLATYDSDYYTHYCFLDGQGKEISRITESRKDVNPAVVNAFSPLLTIKGAIEPVLREDRIKVLDILGNYLYGFANSKGELIIDHKYSRVHDFSEGMAAVAQKNEFGEEMWGFIDLSGNTVIDFKFSKEPGDFHQGLAVVYPRNAMEAGFQLAYINPSGEVVFKANREHPLSSTYGDRDFLSSYLIVLKGKNYYLVDRRGVSTLWVENQRVKFGREEEILVNIYGETPFTKTHLVPFHSHYPIEGFGALNQEAEVVIPPLFKKHLSFASRRAKATLRADPKRTGYIDERGVFVILKKEESQW